MSLKQTIQQLIQGDVMDDQETIKRFSTDYSLLEVVPQLVVAPKNVDDIKKLVSFVNQHKNDKEYQVVPEKDDAERFGLSLTARAAGTDMTGGPLNHGIILDFTKYFNAIGTVVPSADYETGAVTVEPGVYYRDLEKSTLAKELIFPSYPASKSLCAIGGIVNNNAGGEKTLTYGKTERYVQDIHMVLADGKEYAFNKLSRDDLNAKMQQTDFEGQLYRDMFTLIDQQYDLLQQAKPKVTKNSAGYALWNVYDRELGTFDLTQLICGAQGTLGIMTKATLGLIRPKEHSALLVIFIKDLSKLAAIVTTILQHKPETFESYDDKTFKIAAKFFPSLVKTMGIRKILSLGWRFLPEFWMTIIGGAPKLQLVAEFTGDSEEKIYKKAQAAENDVRQYDVKTRIAKDDIEENKYWMIRREAFKLFTDHSHGKRTAPIIDDVVVAPEKLSEFFPKLQEIMSHYDLLFTMQGHIGDGNFHIIPLVKTQDLGIKKLIPKLEEEVFNLVFAYGGSMTGEHNDGLIRSQYLPRMFGEQVYDLFVKTKQIWDPKNIFNPNKKIGDSMEFMLRHVDINPEYTEKKE